MQLIRSSLIVLLAISVIFSEQAEAVRSFSSNHFVWGRLRRRKCEALPSLTCRLRGTKGNKVNGLITFSPSFTVYSPQRQRCEVLIDAKVNMLSPGSHGFHVHIFGDVRASDGTSAGGHFAHPRGKLIEHGSPLDNIRHWGDFGNVIASEDGVALYSRVDTVITLAGILGRGVVIHELEDLGSDAQPTGGAGSRQASCVIGFANPDL